MALKYLIMEMQFAKTQEASFKNAKEKEKPTLVALITILKNRVQWEPVTVWYHSVRQLLPKEPQKHLSSKTKSQQALILAHAALDTLCASQLFLRSLQVQR